MKRTKTIGKTHGTANTGRRVVSSTLIRETPEGNFYRVTDADGKTVVVCIPND